MDAYLHLSGNVGTEVDFREATGGMAPWATFRLAHTPGYRRGTDWVERPTNWFTVSCRRSLAENVLASLRVGDRVMVHGRVRTQSWTDQKTGELRERQVLEADCIGHDLAFGTTNYRKTQRRRDDGPVHAVHSGRGGDDPWSSSNDDAPDAADAGAPEAEVHEFPAGEERSATEPEMEPVS